MSEDELNNVDPLEADTEAPHKAPADGRQGWQMPEPVFRQTSGYLPQGFEKRFPGAFAASAETPAHENTSTASGAAASPDLDPPAGEVEPQPDLPEPPLPEEAAASAPAAAKPRSGAMRMVLVTLGLLMIFAFVGVFLAVVYFLFLVPSGDTGNF